MQIKLREYQIKAMDDLRLSLSKHKRVILSLPTGSGKGVIGRMMVEGALSKGKRSIFAVDRLTLLDQTMGIFDNAKKEKISEVIWTAFDRSIQDQIIKADSQVYL